MKLKVIIFLCFFICSEGFSQERLTLQDCVILAYENNLNLKNQLIKEKNYLQNIKKAKNDRLPTISGSVNGNFMWGRGIDPFTNTYINQQFNSVNGALNGNLVLFQGGYYINNVKLQKQDLETNKSEVQKLKNDLLIDVMQKYTTIMYLNEMVKNYTLIIDNSKSNQNLIQERIDVGNLPEREIYKAISQKESEQYNLINTLNNLSQNWVELKMLLNIPIDSEIVLETLEFYENPDSLYVDKTDFIKNAVAFSPEIKLQRNEHQKALLKLKLAQSNYYPSLSLGGNLSSAYSDVNRNLSFGEQLKNNRSNGLQLIAQIPIFSQLSTRNRVKSARIEIESRDMAISLEQQNVEKIFYRAYNDFITSKQKYTLTKAALISNEMNYDTDMLKYTAGMINLQELNITKTNLSNAIVNASQAKYEMFFNYQVLKVYQGIDLWAEQ